MRWGRWYSAERHETPQPHLLQSKEMTHWPELRREGTRERSSPLKRRMSIYERQKISAIRIKGHTSVSRPLPLEVQRQHHAQSACVSPVRARSGLGQAILRQLSRSTAPFA